MRKEALRFLDKGLEWLDWSPIILFMAAHSHERLGDPDTALGFWKRVVKTMLDMNHEEAPGILVNIDLQEGHFEEALQRFRETWPEAVTLDADDYQMYQYARLLEAAGYEQEAQIRFERAAERLESFCAEEREDLGCRYLPWQVYAELGDRAKTLEWLRFTFLEKRYFANNQHLDTESLDFLRDDAEFQEIMDYLNAEMDRQRARIRQLECVGEMPPAPGIDTSDFCY